MNIKEFLLKNKIKYISFDANEGWPVGDNLFYECLICKEVIPSQPVSYAVCKCGNLSIDTDAARIGAEKTNQVKLIEKE